MSFIDLIIILIVISSIFRGREVGFVRQLFSTVGFFGGLWVGTLLVPHTVQLAHSPVARSLIALLTTLGSAFILLTVGEYIGIVLKTKATLKQINAIDNAMGSVLAVVSILLACWLSASIALSLPAGGLQSAIKSSRLINLLNHALPPATAIIADISHLIEPNGFPQVFTGLEPSPNENIALPNLGDLQPAVQKDAASVVKVEGQGCGGIVEGSGFVAANNLVITNAHVVAGIRVPYIQDAHGTRKATPIWFNPNLDVAILRVTNLAGKPLPIQTTNAPRGTAGAVLGYPGGGRFSANAAVVLDEFTATGRNIYNRGVTDRDVYEIKADIIPGNSGGPMIARDGSVLAVIFAQSTAYNHVGYALQTNAVAHELKQAQARNQTVSTGVCAE